MTADRQRQDDARLVRSTVDGDLAAFDELVRRYQRQATAVSYRLLNNRDDAVEVVQDSLLKAFDKLDTLDKPHRFAPWLMRIVSNLSLNRRRSRALRRTASIEQMRDDEEGRGGMNRSDPQAVSPLLAASGTELGERIADAIERLPEMQRQALVLFSMGGLPQKEVAEILDCSVEAVKWHVFTARKKLKEELSEYL
jgi:RNA polymerase sigma-70 factor (ECF subfamily)